jgi:hypothetical protein
MQYAEVKLGIDISKASFDGYVMKEGQGSTRYFRMMRMDLKYSEVG